MKLDKQILRYSNSNKTLNDNKMQSIIQEEKKSFKER